MRQYIMGFYVDINPKTSKYVLSSKYMKKRILLQCKENHKENMNDNLDRVSDRLAAAILGRKLSYPIYTHDESGELKQIMSPTRRIRKAGLNRILNAFVKADWVMEDCKDYEIIKSIYEDFDIVKRIYDKEYEDAINAVNNFSQEEKGLDYDGIRSLLKYMYSYDY